MDQADAPRALFPPDDPLRGTGIRKRPVVVEAEQALLGAILANNKAFHAVSAFLRPEHFSDPIHQTLFTEIAKGIVAGETVDVVLLKQKLEFRNVLDEVGGTEYLVSLLTAMVAVSMAASYARAIVDAWASRELAVIGETLFAEALARDTDPRTLAATVIARIDATVVVNRVREGVSMDDALDGGLAAAEDAYKRGGQIPGISTGMHSVDRAIDGLVPGEVTILAGRTGMGKSALGWDWGVFAAREARDIQRAGGNPGTVVGISIEMSAAALAQRVLSAASGVPATKIRRGELTATEFQQLIIARRELSGLPMIIEDSHGVTPATIRMKVRKAYRKTGIRLIIIDHLHIVQDDEQKRGNDTNATVNAAARLAMELAKEFGAPVLALAQLNRALLSQDDKRPSLRDLRQGGAIEENADTVLFCHRDEYYLSDHPAAVPNEPDQTRANRLTAWHAERERVRGKGELIVGKRRYGSPNFTIPLGFDGARARWYEPTEAEQEVRAGNQLDMIGGWDE